MINLTHAHFGFSNSQSYDHTRTILIKQTYTVYVDTNIGRRKWHLSKSFQLRGWHVAVQKYSKTFPPLIVAYFTEDTINQLRSVDDIPELVSLVVPHDRYKSARSAKGRPDHIFNPESEGPVFANTQYAQYYPNSSSPAPSPDLSTDHSEMSSNSFLHKPISRRSGPSSTASSDDNTTRDVTVLVPLSFLQEQPSVRREPTDQILLKRLDSYYRQARPLTLPPRYSS